MTVADLIETLKEFPPDHLVVVSGPEERYTPEIMTIEMWVNEYEMNDRKLKEVVLIDWSLERVS